MTCNSNPMAITSECDLPVASGSSQIMALALLEHFLPNFDQIGSKPKMGLAVKKWPEPLGML